MYVHFLLLVIQIYTNVVDFLAQAEIEMHVEISGPVRIQGNVPAKPWSLWIYHVK